MSQEGRNDERTLVVHKDGSFHVVGDGEADATDAVDGDIGFVLGRGGVAPFGDGDG